MWLAPNGSPDGEGFDRALSGIWVLAASGQSNLYLRAAQKDNGTARRRARRRAAIRQSNPRPRSRRRPQEMDGVMNRVPSSPDPQAVKFRSSPSEAPWRELALCLGHDPDLWFPQESDGGANAIRICSACPVRLDCLAWAIEHNERTGIWGGISARKRQRIRAEIRKDGSLAAANLLSSSLRSRDIEALAR